MTRCGVVGLLVLTPVIFRQIFFAVRKGATMRANLVRGFDMVFETLSLQRQLADIARDAAIARSMGDPELEQSIWDETDTWIGIFADRAALYRRAERL
jgi:hypothetical protein